MQNQFEQAQNLHKSGQLAAAENAYRELLTSLPGHPLVLSRLALLLQQTQRSEEALSVIGQAIQSAPNEINLLLQGADLAAQLSEGASAEMWLKTASELSPNNVQLLEKLAGVLISNHREQEALDYVKQAIKLNPQSDNAYNLKGLALSRLGDTDKGYKSFQKALKINPGQLGVVRNLIIYGKGKKEPLLEQIIPQLEQKIVPENQPAQLRTNLAYILSMYYERKKNAEKAFRYLKLGNDLSRATYQYDSKQTDDHFSQLLSAFGQLAESQTAASAKGIDDNSPIFILGMPRSGTTLIEQILSSHSEVEAEGEILDLNQAFELRAQTIMSGDDSASRFEACSEAAKDYIELVRQRNKAARFTDKMPYNFMLVGLIALAMPHAKIIHCTRDPVETCFSIYKQNFAGNHRYKNNLKELGEYYQSYSKMMASWETMFPDRVFEANYERMVDDSENEIKRLLAFCDLELENACMGFHKNKRAVRTASVAQVRQPIYRDAKKASAAYQQYLGDLIKALELN